MKTTYTVKTDEQTKTISGFSAETKTSASALPDLFDYSGEYTQEIIRQEIFDRLGISLDPADILSLVTNAVPFVGPAITLGKTLFGFLDFATSASDTAEESMADLLEANHDLLLEIQAELAVVTDQLDAALEGIAAIDAQLDSSVMIPLKTAVMNLRDVMRTTVNPDEGDLAGFALAGEKLMNLARNVWDHMTEHADVAFIAGHVVPVMMSAISWRMVSATYGSDTGLAHSTVKEDVIFVHEAMAGFFSESGPLAEQILAEVEEELWGVYGTNDDGVLQFIFVQTVTGPAGSKQINVVASHDQIVGFHPTDDFPGHYTRFGSIDGETDPDAINAKLATLTIDALIQHHSDADIQFNDHDFENDYVSLTDWLVNSFVESAQFILPAELEAVADNQVTPFLDDLPDTYGWDEADHGGAGNDVIEGVSFDGVSHAPDLIFAGAGNDEVHGLGERDVLHGEGGYDSLYGGGGADKLYGGSQSDELRGNGWHDQLFGQGGADVMYGGKGDDAMYQSVRGDFDPHNAVNGYNGIGEAGGAMYGGAGHDLLVGDNGLDYMEGGAGRDMLFGFNGADEMHGGIGEDVLEGGRGNDDLFGGDSADTLEGGHGDDELNGGYGDDQLSGGVGDDFISAGHGFDQVRFNGNLDSFDFSTNADGNLVVTDTRKGLETEGVDTIVVAKSLSEANLGVGAEQLVFFDEVVNIGVQEPIDGFLDVKGAPNYEVNQDLLGDGSFDLNYDKNKPIYELVLTPAFDDLSF